MSKPGDENDSGARKPEVCVSEPLTPTLSFIINEIKRRDAGGSGINPSALPVYIMASTLASMTTSF